MLNHKILKLILKLSDTYIIDFKVRIILITFPILSKTSEYSKIVYKL